MFQNSFSKVMMKYLSLIVLIQIIIIGAIFTWDVSSYTASYKHDVLISNIKAQVALTDEWLSTEERLISQYSTLLEQAISTQRSKEQITDYVDMLASQNSAYAQVYFTTESGMNIISSGAVPRVDGRERAWYKGALVREFFISMPYQDVLTDEYVITLSKAIHDQDGKLIGVIGADLKLTDILKRIQDVDNYMIAGVILTDYEQNILFADMAASEVAKISVNGVHKVLDSKSTDYEPVIVSSSKMNASITVYLKKGNYLLELVRDNYDFWIALMAGVTGLMIVLSYISKLLAEPVKLLADNIKRIAGRVSEGDISQENMDNDLQEVYQLFRNLDQHIRGNIRQINQMNDNMKQANEILESKNEEFQQSLLELKFTNQDLKHSEHIYQNLIDNIEELIWVADLNGKIIYANDKFYNWLGMTNVDQIDLSLADFIKELQESSGIEGIGFFANRDFADLDLSLNHPWATRAIDLNVHTTVIYFMNQAMSVQFIGRDVTEERRLYKQYAQKNREMMILNDISRSLTMKEDLISVLQLITDRISNLVNVAGATIRMLENTDYLVLKAVSGTDLDHVYREDIRMDGVQMGIALQEGKMISITKSEDVVIEDQHLKTILAENKSVYYFPLFNRENRFGVLTVISKAPFDMETLMLLRSLSENASTAIEKASLFEKLKFNYLMTIEALSNALEEKVFNYKNHTKRVAEFSKLIAERFYLSKKELDDIYISGLLHDIGKLGIADDLLNRENVLTEQEYEAMMAHVEIGKRIIQPIGLSDNIAEGIYLHHKNYDLTGYPEISNIDKLPIFARIIGVADAFDTMLIDAKSHEDWKLELIMSQLDLSSGSMYCPEVLAALRELIDLRRERVLEIASM